MVSSEPGRELYAHSLPGRPLAEWELLPAHALLVAKTAAGFARQFGHDGFAYMLGLLHDTGKASEEFQAYIRGEITKGGDHSTWGARIAVGAYAGRYRPFGMMAAYCIAGHHAGLPDWEGLDSRLDAARRPIPNAARWQEAVQLPSADTLPASRRIDASGQVHPLKNEDAFRARAAFSYAFLTRMLFSCLVDADCLATESFMQGMGLRPGIQADLGKLYERLQAHLAALRAEAKPSPVNTLRAEILDHAVAKAALKPGFFTLTVPTGGGKTLTSLAFALAHARKHGKRRVVFVVPFTAIIEQTAEVFRKALGDSSVILEHHSTFDWEVMAKKAEDGGDERDKLGPLRLATENWDVPIVVTTAVQFFESLFANRTSACRKLHNLADSVIVLDEAQTMPTKFLLPCLAALEELAKNYGTSVVLCTATQPAVRVQDGALYHRKKEIEHGIDIPDDRELAPRPAELGQELERVKVERRKEPVSDEEIAARFAEQPRMLCIVNSRAHASALFKRIAGLDGAFHLSTLMCPAHRREVIAELKARLADPGKPPVRLVATSLIEAGVDIDFPEVWRASAGLDQIIQAAGRCNREGRLGPELGRVVVFDPAEHQPPRALVTLQKATTNIPDRYSDRLLSTDAIREYFRQLYSQKGFTELDNADVFKEPNAKKGIMDAFAVGGMAMKFPFEKVAKAFRLIDEAMTPVVVPWNDDAEEALDRVSKAKRPSRDDLRRLQNYTVAIPDAARKRWLGDEIVAVRTEFGEALLRFKDTRLYKPETGIDLSGDEYGDAEKNVW